MINYTETIPARNTPRAIVAVSDKAQFKFRRTSSATISPIHSASLPCSQKLFFSNSGTIVLETVTDQAGSEDIPMPANEFELLCDAIDNQIAAMTHDQYIEALLATAGAWADLENLTDEGFTGTPWGFDRYQIGDQDAPKLPV